MHFDPQFGRENPCVGMSHAYNIKALFAIDNTFLHIMKSFSQTLDDTLNTVSDNKLIL